MAENLRKWKTGGLRRLSLDKPFPEVIPSGRTPRREAAISDHPCLKPQHFMRIIVRALLPLGEGTVLDPFMGSGSTIAAAEAIGYRSVGIEIDKDYFRLAEASIPKLAALYLAATMPGGGSPLPKPPGWRPWIIMPLEWSLASAGFRASMD